MVSGTWFAATGGDAHLTAACAVSDTETTPASGRAHRHAWGEARDAADVHLRLSRASRTLLAAGAAARCQRRRRQRAAHRDARHRDADLSTAILPTEAARRCVDLARPCSCGTLTGAPYAALIANPKRASWSLPPSAPGLIATRHLTVPSPCASAFAPGFRLPEGRVFLEINPRATRETRRNDGRQP